jgi:uncharacterized membrane protein
VFANDAVVYKMVLCEREQEEEKHRPAKLQSDVKPRLRSMTFCLSNRMVLSLFGFFLVTH